MRLPFRFSNIAALLVGAALYVGGVLWTSRLTYAWSQNEELRFGPDLRGVWLWPRSGQEPFPGVIFANGGTGTLPHNLPLAVELSKYGVACFLFDFAGQGGSRSGGQPEQDLKEAISYFRNHPKVDRSRLGAVGHSLGGRLISEHSREFRGEVIFGNLPEQESPDILIAYSRYEFLFDRPDGPNVVIGPWTDHLTGPMDPILLNASMRWFGNRLGFQPSKRITEPTRLLARIVALLGGALVVLGLVLALPVLEPAPAGSAPISSSFLWVTSVGTLALAVLLARRERPQFRLSDASRFYAVLIGGAFFGAVYLLSAIAFSWSYFDVVLHLRKLPFFLGMSVVFSLIQWHDQALIHGRLIEAPEVRWRELWVAGLLGSAGRWLAAVLVFSALLLAGGRSGVWMILSLVCFVTFWLEGLGAVLSCRARHGLAGATFLGMAWSWLWTVFLPM